MEDLITIFFQGKSKNETLLITIGVYLQQNIALSQRSTEHDKYLIIWGAGIFFNFYLCRGRSKFRVYIYKKIYFRLYRIRQI